MEVDDRANMGRVPKEVRPLELVVLLAEVKRVFEMGGANNR